jgi:hypothetical protein
VGVIYVNSAVIGHKYLHCPCRTGNELRASLGICASSIFR